MSIKLRIPDEGELKKRIQAILSTVQKEITSTHEAEIAAYKAAKKQKLYATLLLIALVVGFFIVSVLPSQVLLTGLVVLFVLTIRAWWRYLKQGGAVAAYHFAITNTVLKNIAALFGLPITFVHHRHIAKSSSPQTMMTNLLSYNEEQGKAKANLTHSELITEPYNRFKVDDGWRLELQGTPLSVSELSVQNVTRSGKQTHVHDIFHGYLVSYKLPKKLEGKTFISTEGDTSGFGHQNFWSSFKSGGVSTTTLEWNEFENLLHIATNNPTEARYILTPDVMQDVYDWWVEQGGNIRVSFIDNQMYILFPDKKMRINSSVANLTEDEIEAYLFLLARPLMHTLHLAEDIRKRFR